MNLFLELLCKRPDGYHEIETVMIPVSRFDTLLVRHTPDQPGVRLHTHWRPSPAYWSNALGPAANSLLSIPDDPTNLIHRAVTATQTALGVPGGFEITAHKRVPAGAGMGGASSDAAAAIQAVAKLAGDTADPDQLIEIAAALGSDVPFFLPSTTGPTLAQQTVTLATGRGERLQPIAIPRRLWFVVAYPRGGLSTARVYAASQVPAHPVPASYFLAALTADSLSGVNSRMLNRLTQQARGLAPAVEELLERMESCGLQPAQMTGSGSACFHICHDRDQAEMLGKRLRNHWSKSASAGLVMVLSSVSQRTRWRFCH